MYINATLLVQIIHFLIAYFILRTLFFGPALRELDSEKQERLVLENDIQGVRLALERKQSTRDAQWREVQQFYVRNRPALDDHESFFFRNLTPGLAAPRIQEREIGDLIDRTSSEFTKKIRKIYHV